VQDKGGESLLEKPDVLSGGFEVVPCEVEKVIDIQLREGAPDDDSVAGTHEMAADLDSLLGRRRR